MIPLFADTFFLALLNPRDPASELAASFADMPSPPKLITTTFVLVELGDAMSAVKRRAAFLSLVRLLRNSTTTQIVPATQALFDSGLQLFSQRRDKEWSLTDCISFEVMRRNKLRDTLTGDRHFEQPGFNALLK